MEEQNTATTSAPVQPIVMWRSDTSLWKAVEVECPDGLWPHNDSDGEQIFDNTHFETREEAEKHLRAEARAGLHLAGHALDNARKDVERLEKRAADWAVIWSRLIDT